MKFTKVALVTALAIAATAAQAQTANVTLYGYINTSLENNRGSTRTTSVTINRMTSNSSQFGFRGTESLGGGLNAVFDLQNGFGSDDGNLNGGVMFGRRAQVGLQGGFGAIKFGYDLTPYDDVLGLSHQNIGSTGMQNRNNGLASGPGFASAQLFTNYGRGGTPGCATDGNFDARSANALAYNTPNMGGLVIRTMYSLIEETGSAGCKLWDTSAVYSNGPITAGLAYSLHKNFRGFAGATVGAGAIGNTTGSHDQTAYRAYGRYNFGVARVDAAYEVMNWKVASGSLKAKYWEFGAQMPLGAANIGVQYSARDNGTAFAYSAPLGTSIVAATPIKTIRDSWTVGGGKHFALVADYSFSKRTQVYAYYAAMKNETGGKLNTPAVGLIHRF